MKIISENEVKKIKEAKIDVALVIKLLQSKITSTNLSRLTKVDRMTIANLRLGRTEITGLTLTNLYRLNQFAVEYFN